MNDERIGLQVQCNSLTAALEEATRKCFEYKEKAARRKNELEKTGKLTWWLQEQSYVYEQKIAELEKTISTLTRNLAELRSQQNEKDILISLLEQQNLQLTEESGRKEQLLQTQTQQIEKYARQIVQLQEELKTQESSCPASSMKKKIQELASTLVTIINENQVLEERNAALEAQTTAALASKKEAEKKLIDAETTVSSLVLLNSDLEQKVEEAKAMVTEKDTEVKSLEKENLCLEAENSKLKGTVEQLYEVITKQSLINSIGGGSGSGSESGSSGSNPSLICFSDDSLRTATSDYTDKNKLVSSVSGDFYKGTHYQTPIMVRKTREGASLNTLAQDLSILSRFRHVNILGLLGYSGDIKNCSLVFEYAPNGTLRERLDKKGNTPPLSWPERLSIAFDIAVALNYLQNADSRAPVFHLGLTSSNVFLDSQFRAKISGFESAKPACFQDNLSGSNAFINHSPSIPRPNIDPIFALERKVSRKTDVYSYGCVLLELLTGMHISLGICAKLANYYKHKGHIKDQLDKDLKANEAELDSSVDVVSKIFYQSVQISWLERPGFPQIIKTLMDKSDFSVQGEHNDCSVCTGEPINSQFGPCGHSVMCQECAQKWITEKRDCLVCSLPVTSFSVLPTTPNEDYVIM